MARPCHLPGKHKAAFQKEDGDAAEVAVSVAVHDGWKKSYSLVLTFSSGLIALQRSPSP